MDHFCYLYFVFVCHTHCLAVGCSLHPYDHMLGRADLLALLYVIFYFVFVTFPCDALSWVWYLIVSIPNRFLLSYFDHTVKVKVCFIVNASLSKLLDTAASHFAGVNVTCCSGQHLKSSNVK